MDKPISVGDLVYVARTCCEAPIKDGVRIGLPWRVEIVAQLNPSRCKKCGFTDNGLYASSNEIKRAKWNCAPVSWLKRIPPLSELDDVKRDEELTA
jgi:predicted Zn-ribbon and HTH transcriptional regulator